MYATFSDFGLYSFPLCPWHSILDAHSAEYTLARYLMLIFGPSSKPSNAVKHDSTAHFRPNKDTHSGCTAHIWPDDDVIFQHLRPNKGSLRILNRLVLHDMGRTPSVLTAHIWPIYDDIFQLWKPNRGPLRILNRPPSAGITNRRPVQHGLDDANGPLTDLVNIFNSTARSACSRWR
jgi:hypothetical protein